MLKKKLIEVDEKIWREIKSYSSLEGINMNKAINKIFLDFLKNKINKE